MSEVVDEGVLGRIPVSPWIYSSLGRNDESRRWNYASLERLLEDATDDVANGTAVPVCVMAPDGEIVLEGEALRMRLRKIYERRRKVK